MDKKETINYLFEQIERLNDDELDEEALDQELKKADAIVKVSEKIIANFNAINSAEALVEDTKWETNVSDLKDRYEEAYFDKVFKGKCEKLLEGDPKEKEPIAEQIKKEIEASNCKACFFQAEEYYFEPLQDKINVLKA